jgi:hypothetical protein
LLVGNHHRCVSVCFRFISDFLLIRLVIFCCYD